MCLSVPMRVTKIQGDRGLAEIGGMGREIDLRFLSQVEVGDYVIVHAGFALQRLEQKEAEETLDLLREMLEQDETSG
jgi:hydrogenase expression/formation protein HypC